LATKKITDLAALATPAGADLLEIVDDVVGTATSKKVTLTNLSLGLGAASTTAQGAVEIAINTEVDTGTDATRAISPDALAGSTIFGRKQMQMVPFDFATDNATGDGKFYTHIPASMNGMNLVSVHAYLITAGTTGVETIQIHNLTQTADMLSTEITIDTGANGSDTAATPAVINAAEDDVATNDVIRVDVDSVHTTPGKGLIVTLEFSLP